MIKLGEKIKQLRKSRNLSQEALARILSVSIQAVSKWETGTTSPDVNLLPAIASYFGISMDELFDFNTRENERIIEDICRRAARLIRDDVLEADKLLCEGLKQYPANETLLTVRVYALWVIPGMEDELIATCNTLLECCTNQGVKCDVLRFLAMTYHKTGQFELVDSVLDQIPEFYFTKLEWIAKLSDGEKSLNAARFQMNLSGCSTIEMLKVMANRYSESGDLTNANRCLRIADGVLDVFRKEGGRDLELPGYQWIDEIQ